MGVRSVAKSGDTYSVFAKLGQILLIYREGTRVSVRSFRKKRMAGLLPARGLQDYTRPIYRMGCSGDLEGGGGGVGGKFPLP